MQPERWTDGIGVVGSSIVFLLVRQVLGLLTIGPKPDERDVEIAVLRHQLALLQRQTPRPRYSPADRALLATLARPLPRQRWSALFVTPTALLRWHRQLVARHWTYPHTGRAGAGLDPSTVELIVRLAKDNPRWGYLPITGELDKLGVVVSATSVRNILRRHPP